MEGEGKRDQLGAVTGPLKDQWGLDRLEEASTFWPEKAVKACDGEALVHTGAVKAPGSREL